ncbi:hypothetical protein ACP70R_043549 [Stipagrostis hirtigluma subsp. patula]
MAMQLAVALLAVSVLASGAAAQTPNPPSCASKLVPCGQYINGTGTPPDTCCGPLKDAVQNDLLCLCGLYASPEIFRVFHINITDALRLSKRCGLSDTTTACPVVLQQSPLQVLHQVVAVARMPVIALRLSVSWDL